MKTIFLKKLLFVAIFSLSIFSVYPQNTGYKKWKVNYDKGLELIEIDSLDKALPHLKKSLELAELIKIDSIAIKSLDQLSKIHENLGNYKEAESVIKYTLKLTENTVGKSSKEYSDKLQQLSIIHKRRSNYKKAVQTALLSNEIIKSIYGTSSLEYIDNLSNLSKVYAEISEYDLAISIQKKVLQYFENKDKTSDEYAYACFTMSYLNHYVNEYESEIEYMKKAMAIYGEDHVASSTFNNNIGLAHQNLGNHEQALLYFLNALKKTKNKKNKGYAIRLQNLAFSYASLGEFDKAETTYNDVLDIWNEFLDKKHKDYGKLLNNIGKLYRETGKYEKAKRLFKESLDHFSKNFDNNHTRYGYRLNDYASVLLELGQTSEAIDLMKGNLQLAIDNAKTNTEDFYNRQYNLAKAYNKAGNYNQALPLLKSAIENIPNILGDYHAKYGQMLKSLSYTYLGLGNIEKAIPLIESSNEILINQIDQIFNFRSEKEKQSFIKMLTRHFDDLQSLSLINDNFDRLNAINLNNQLMLKGLLLNSSKNVLTELSTLNDAKIDTMIVDFKTNKRLIAKVLTQPIIDREYSIDSLKNITNRKEAALVKLYSDNFKNNISLIKNWKQSQSKLKNKEIAIEFSHFKKIHKGMQTDSIMYVAYLFEASSKNPKMVPLFEERELRSILSKNNSPNELYKSKELHSLIWEPLSKHIKKKKNIFYSSSGLLNQLSLSAIPIRNNVLINRYNLIQLSNIDILANSKVEPDKSNALFIGGVNYEYSVISKNKEAIENNDKYNYLESAGLSNSRGTKSRGESWTYLPGTLTEIQTLKSQFETRGNSVDTLSKNKATEANFKKLSRNSPKILHIATHGFFYENLDIKAYGSANLSTEDQYRLSEDPLLRSGLILAGANYAWKNGTNPYEDEDGILTAMEISNLDLSNTDMVVLSACETGLGDIDGSEGVYGLQRAFKMAGVDFIVMSLWQVPDAETSEFMNVFYENWLNGKKVKLAFINAQRKMYRKYKNEPLKWAAFVLFE